MTTTAVRERPILFSGEMVRAILDGRKTQTRRVVKFPSFRATPRGGAKLDHIIPPAPAPGVPFRGMNGRVAQWADDYGGNYREVASPYGQPGDRLYVRERHRLLMCSCDTCRVPGYVWYDADESGYRGARLEKPRPSIHMPRWASRLTLEITDVRVEPVQSITGAGAKAEGVADPVNPFAFSEHLTAFQRLWEKLNGPRGYGWDANPWVWVVSFRRVDGR